MKKKYHTKLFLQDLCQPTSKPCTSFWPPYKKQVKPETPPKKSVSMIFLQFLSFTFYVAQVGHSWQVLEVEILVK